MKSTLLVWSSLLLLTFALTNPSIAAVEVDATEPVLDMDGEQLRTGTKYYILPVPRSKGGGLTMSVAENETCPLAVVQYPPQALDGFPLAFTPVNPNEEVIRVSIDLNIKFIAPTTCPEPTLWKIQKSVNSNIQWLVVTGGVEGNPGIDTVTNWFKNEKFDDDYKLVYCPTVCDCPVLCRDIGIYIQHNGLRPLSLSNALKPFKIQFKK